MSARHTFLSDMSERLCRLAIALSREDVGLYRTSNELIADARGLITAGDAARAAIAAGRSPRTAYAKAKQIAAVYLARVVDRGELAGMVLGIAFTSGQFVCGADNICFIA